MRKFAAAVGMLALAGSAFAQQLVQSSLQSSTQPSLQSSTRASTQPALQPALQARQVNSADVASVDAIVAALYDTISGPAGRARDWSRLRALFRPDGRMIVHGLAKEGGNEGSYQTRVMAVDDYIERVAPLFAREGFFETELARQVEQFGAIAHVFSTYESRHAPGDKPVQRGINSIQLVNDGQRWWIQSLVWQAESAQHPLPQRYLQGR
ncbi:hypothetical protein [Pseudoduganella chitinolytica]|uniref:Nuclear transport factor 2 family protein n=1 Tax=Pseudoduganella chitinolytica TaxID=34070 RepID=A0ABY8B629_9BURK|nr:hypothetical protein [Pseudoduganella chitinolytica]WEF31270.1 hypothetical protein PX653_17610 [Pseudoduganella chitinolytica]